VILYPLEQVSPVQERQFATLGGNVLALAVRGTFDDCQRLTKQAFADADLRRRVRLTSANSINVGRFSTTSTAGVSCRPDRSRSSRYPREILATSPPA
jgi:threonine synthase